MNTKLQIGKSTLVVAIWFSVTIILMMLFSGHESEISYSLGTKERWIVLALLIPLFFRFSVSMLGTDEQLEWCSKYPTLKNLLWISEKLCVFLVALPAKILGVSAALFFYWFTQTPAEPLGLEPAHIVIMALYVPLFFLGGCAMQTIKTEMDNHILNI